MSVSTADAKYTTLFRGGEQAFWLRQLYQQIGLPLTTPLELYCDSESTIAIAKNEGTHSKSKAICIEFHAVREQINCRKIEIEYVNSKGNIADVLTKSLPRKLSGRRNLPSCRGTTDYSDNRCTLYPTPGMWTDTDD